jgi:hypothetical protein
VEYKLKLVACYQIKHENLIALHFQSKLSELWVCNARIIFSPFHKKRTVRLPSGFDPHGCEFFYGYVDINLKNFKCKIK